MWHCSSFNALWEMHSFLSSLSSHWAADSWQSTILVLSFVQKDCCQLNFSLPRSKMYRCQNKGGHNFIDPNFRLIGNPKKMIAQVTLHMITVKVKTIGLVCIHKNKQLLDWPFTRLLLEALCIKTSTYLQVKGIDISS